jgi:hypothetical protein
MLGKPSHRLRKRLEENGRTANATVIEIASRGMTVTTGNEQIVANTKVVLKTKLSVQPDGEPAFEVEQRFRYSQFAIPSVGSVLPVIYDPDDHDKIMLDESPTSVMTAGMAQAGITPDTQNLIAQLQQAKADGASREAMADMARQWGQAHGATVIDGNTLAGMQAQAMQAMQGMQGMQGFAAPAAPSAESTADQLEKLADLRDRGVLTEAEFQAQKAKILSG